MILHQIEALAAAGVTDIVLAVNYRPEIMTAALKKVSLNRSHAIRRFELTEHLTVRARIQHQHHILRRDRTSCLLYTSPSPRD